MHFSLVGIRRSRLHVNADDRLAQGAQGFEAGVAEFEAELIFAFCLEGVMTFVAGGVGWALPLFSDVDFRMDFERDHKIFPVKYRGMRMARLKQDWGLERKELSSAIQYRWVKIRIFLGVNALRALRIGRRLRTKV